MAFPLHRYRRLRLTESLRAMVRETTLDPADFIAPMFVVPGEGIRQPIPSMPGIDRVSVDLAARDAAELARRGESGRLLWPRGSDADAAPVAELAARGFDVSAPVVYVKEPLPALDAERLRAFRAGEYGAVAVGSLAALDVFLAALGAAGPDDLPPVRFGVLGPESARLLVARGLPGPLVPAKPLLSELIAILEEA